MRKNDFDPPICLSIAKLTVEINFQTIKKKKNQKNKQTKNQKNKLQTTAQKAEKI